MNVEVKDIMVKDVFKLHDTDNVGDAMRYMAEKEVSGLPIVNKFDRLVGFVTGGDFMKFLFKLGKSHNPLFADSLESIENEDLDAIDALRSEIDATPVMDIATRKVVTVYDDDSYDEAARILGKKKIKTVAVINEDDEMVGILSRSCVLRFLFEESLKRA